MIHAMVDTSIGAYSAGNEIYTDVLTEKDGIHWEVFSDCVHMHLFQVPLNILNCTLRVLI